jgi:hypothetical protein
MLILLDRANDGLFLKTQIRIMNIVKGSKLFASSNRKVVLILEASLRIRFPIHWAVFGVDFFILPNPNLKKSFI